MRGLFGSFNCGEAGELLGKGRYVDSKGERQIDG